MKTKHILALVAGLFFLLILAVSVPVYVLLKIGDKHFAGIQAELLSGNYAEALGRVTKAERRTFDAFEYKDSGSGAVGTLVFHLESDRYSGPARAAWRRHGTRPVIYGLLDSLDQPLYLRPDPWQTLAEPD